ncbi:RagB/SusD family nutrient uptake outer membrane protein [Bacteroides fragilis]|nr:RagB/SusD family nutrient uptake outer membrane protein [Bacteroides fragilis]
MDGLHKHLRDVAEQHILPSESKRGGIYKSGNASDGNALYYGSIILQNFDKNNTGVTGFGGHYGRLANINLFIDRVTKADYVDDAKKKFYLGQAYGYVLLSILNFIVFMAVYL